MTVSPASGATTKAFDQALRGAGAFPLIARDLRTIQVNIGLMCNQNCRHCHLSCSPGRCEIMAPETMAAVCDILEPCGAELVDITGGEPCLHPRIRQFIEALTSQGIRTQLRTNFTGLLVEGNESLPEFLCDHDVQLVGSLPCYSRNNVDAQRGVGVHRASIEAIRRLNQLGYGRDPNRRLDLVHNPAGVDLPPDQGELEAEYRAALHEHHGLSFTHLLTIANMPIGRFRAELDRRGRHDQYARVLRKAFNPGTLPALMCRHQISVRWDGKLFDCDFNLALDCSVNHGASDWLGQFEPKSLSKRRVVTGEHCFGCTAGSGSSCSGALM